MKEKALIRIVDNDAEHCEALKFLLSVEGWQVKTYTSSAEFFREKDWVSPGCIILDYRMPEIDGIELQELLISENCRLPILFLTAHADVDMAIQVFKKGANDLLKKPVDADALFKAVDEAVARDAKRREKEEPETESELLALLSPREKQIIDLVLLGLMNSQIARRLGLSERTVEVHRANAYRKLRISNIKELKEAKR